MSLAEEHFQFIADEEGRQKYDENEYIALAEDMVRPYHKTFNPKPRPHQDSVTNSCHDHELIRFYVNNIRVQYDYENLWV